MQGLRLNPGNIRNPDHIKAVAAEARDRGLPIRIGVNGGSLDKELYEKYGGRITAEAMVESAQRELGYFEEVGFDDVKISVKASNVALMIDAYRLLADTVDHPLHLGVTEAGPPPAGLVKATAGMATLLAEGIGDTIRYSLTADPVEEVRAGRWLLESLGLRERRGLDLIACPSCGRAEVDVIEVANKAQAALDGMKIPIQVAVMGCVVNGPGEAREADLGIAAGRKRGHLFVKGEVVKVVPEDAMVEALVEWAEIIAEGGVEEALRRKDDSAAAEAEADREALLDEQGDRRQPRRRAHRADPQARLTPTLIVLADIGDVRTSPMSARTVGRSGIGGTGGSRASPSIGALWPSNPCSPPRPRTSPAGTRTSSPRRRWPTTARCGARWSSAPTATPSGSGCRPRSTVASRLPGPRTPTSRCSSPRAT